MFRVKNASKLVGEIRNTKFLINVRGLLCILYEGLFVCLKFNFGGLQIVLRILFTFSHSILGIDEYKYKTSISIVFNNFIR